MKVVIEIDDNKYKDFLQLIEDLDYGEVIESFKDNPKNHIEEIEKRMNSLKEEA